MPVSVATTNSDASDSRAAHHPARREDMRLLHGLVAFRRKIHGGGRAPAFGVNHEIRAGVLVARAGDRYRLHGSVDMALAPPDVDVLPSGYLADVVARNMSGRKRISWLSGIDSTIWTALAEVQQ